MLILKPGVSLWGLQPAASLATHVVDGVFSRLFGAFVETVITSGADGAHKEGSYHGTGEAFDVRTKSLVGHSKREVAKEVAVALGGSGAEKGIKPGTFAYDGGEFDVLLEDLGGPNEHLHVELDRRRVERLRREKGLPV